MVWAGGMLMDKSVKIAISLPENILEAAEVELKARRDS
jgi:hypothetical protein